MARFNASKLRSAISRYNSAVNRYNSAARQHNANLRRAVADHNRRVRRFNTQVRELQRQLAALQRHPPVRAYSQLRVDLHTVVTYQESALVVREQEWHQLDHHEQASLQDATQEEGIELMLVDGDGDEV
jgi:DNA repair exonuclease SbcCD ATPase subunit